MSIHYNLKFWFEKYSDMLLSGNVDFNSDIYKEFIDIFEDRSNQRLCYCSSDQNHDLLDVAPHILDGEISTQTCYSLVTGLSSMFLRAGIDPQKYFPHIPYRFLYRNSHLSEYTVDSGKHYIERFAFCQCSNLKKLVLPADISSIKDYAFAFCTKLNNIVFLGTVEQWKQITFGNCCWTNVPCSNVVCSDGSTKLRVKHTYC